MDNYIKMVNCPEIQGQWKTLKIGDRILWGGVNEDAIRDADIPIPDRPPGESNGWIIEELKEKGVVWLPRQEDIQEMLPKQTTWFENLFRFYDWMTRKHENPFDSPCQKYTSTTELWLAFYMQVCHKTVWDGEQWAM